MNNNGIIDINAVLPIIEEHIDNEVGSEYSTLRDVVIMHNRAIAKRRLGPENPAVLYIKDYNLKITYSRQNGSALSVEQVSEVFVKDWWFCVNLNQPIELKNKRVELRFNGHLLELVAMRQCKTILSNLEMVETMEEFASFQFDLVNKKTNYFGESSGWKGLKDAGLGEFSKFLHEKGCVYVQGHRECFNLVKQAMDSNPEFAMAAKECNLKKVAQFGLSNLIMVMYQYISNESIKYLVNSNLGFYLLERFNREFKHQMDKMEVLFKQVFQPGVELLEILGIEEKDRGLFSKLLESESRFYSEWCLYNQKQFGKRGLSYFGSSSH